MRIRTHTAFIAQQEKRTCRCLNDVCLPSGRIGAGDRDPGGGVERAASEQSSNGV